MIAQLLSKVDYIHKKDAHNYLLNVLLERRLEILKHDFKQRLQHFSNKFFVYS